MSIQPTDNSHFASLDYARTDEQEITVSSTNSIDSVVPLVSKGSSAVAADETLSLTALGAQLDAASDVDWEQVSQIRQAIESGELTVDLDSLSQSILEMHQS